MSRDLSDVIARLSAGIAAGDKNPHYRRAAALTGGVPVYADIGGILVIARDGEVVSVDIDDDVTTRETQWRWRLLALAIAARSYPELRDLAPPRPAGARACEMCAGTGMFHGFHCGECHHLGWVTEDRARLDDVIALNPQGPALRREVLAHRRGQPTPQVVASGVQILEDRTAALCALFCHLLPTTSRHARSIVRNGFFTTVAVWLQILGPHLQQLRHPDLEIGAELLRDIWMGIAERADARFEDVVPLLIAGSLVGSGLRGAYEGGPLLRPLDEVPSVARSELFASLRRCESLRDLVREARAQLGFAESATR